MSATVAAVIGLLVLCGSSIHAADSAKPDNPVAITKTCDIKAVYRKETGKSKDNPNKAIIQRLLDRNIISSSVPRP
ncbi:MAG: hypothetical protein PF904_05215 [Kiritimatiellae bacterium]|nr:hypothetical protein [Kiritimatiellia bacterium]